VGVSLKLNGSHHDPSLSTDCWMEREERRGEKTRPRLGHVWAGLQIRWSTVQCIHSGLDYCPLPREKKHSSGIFLQPDI
jgi:hypothetical protein